MKKEEWKINGSKVTSDRFNFTIYSNRGNATITRCEAEQVAKRMAACDDLLEACNELLELLKFHGYEHSTEIYKAKAAIKKATE